jgi:hypothetical protein
MLDFRLSQASRSSPRRPARLSYISMKKHLVFICLILAACTSSQMKNERKPQSLADFSADEVSAIEQLERIMKPHIVLLDRDLITFRYESGDGKFKPQTLEQVQKREAGWAVRFYDPDKVSGSDVGPGVYVAMEPTASATWGQDDPHLFVIPIKAGSRILVGDQYNVDPADAELGFRLRNNMECWPPDQHPHYPMFELGEFVGAFRYSPNATCRRIMIKVFQDLDIQALTYSYGSTYLKECRNSGTAISIVDPTVIDLSRMNYYSVDKKIEGDPKLTPFVKSTFDEGKTAFQQQNMLNTEAYWRSYKSDFGFFDSTPSVDANAYSEWKAANLYRCGPKWVLEENHPVDLVSTASAIFEANNRDYEIEDLYLKTKFAYVVKFKDFSSHYSNQDFVANNLQGLIIAEYDALNPNMTVHRFETVQHGYAFPDTYANAAAELGEKLPFKDDAGMNKSLAKFFAKLTEDQMKNPNLLAVALNHIHVPKKSATLIVNAMLVELGMAPNLSGHLPKSLDEDTSAERANSRAGYMRLLKRCFDMYKDPNKSAAEISRGACGVRKNT